MKQLFVLLAGALVLAGCNANYEQTKSGLRYKVIKGKGGDSLRAGDFIQFNQIALIPERDTVLFTTYGKMPGFTRIDTGANIQYTFGEVLPKMRVGDSAIIIFSVDSLLSKGMIRAYDNAFRKGGQITFRLKVEKKYTSEEAVNADYEAAIKKEQDRLAAESEESAKAEVKELEDYFKKNNITAVKTPAGAYVQIDEKGASPVGASGMMAQVFYTGKIFKTGNTFDSNVGKEPIPVVLGEGRTIVGFEEGLMMFGKGGKGIIYIPSNIGYGAQGSPPVIPPNSTLLFEVEIADLQPGAAGGMPPSADPHGH